MGRLGRTTGSTGTYVRASSPAAPACVTSVTPRRTCSVLLWQPSASLLRSFKAPCLFTRAKSSTQLPTNLVMSELTASSLHVMPIDREKVHIQDDINPSTSTSGGCSTSSTLERPDDDEYYSDDEQLNSQPGENSSHIPQSEASILAYWSASSKEFTRDLLVKVGLIVLFAAGLMRTSIPSLLYAIMSVQALYSTNRVALKSLFPKKLVALVLIIAIAMIIFHVTVNVVSNKSSALILQVFIHVAALCFS